MRSCRGWAALGFVLWLVCAASAYAQNGAAKRLAPNGELRAAVMTWNPVLVSRSVDGKFSGISIDLIDAFAAKLGVPVRLVPYGNLIHYNQSFGKDEWDISLGPRELTRAGSLAFSDVVMAVENGYVARADVSLRAASEVDRNGIKVAVTEGSPLAGYLSRTMINAKIIRLPAGANFARDALSYRRADVYADSTPQVARVATGLPGARLLIGHINTVQMSFAVPKKNADVLPIVNAFVADAKRDGVIAEAVKRANLRGVRPAR